MRGNAHTDGFGIRRLARALAFFAFLAVLGLGCRCEEETVSGTPGAAPGAAPRPPAEQAARDTARGHAAPRRSVRIEDDESEALQVPRGRSAEGTSPDAAERGPMTPVPERDEEYEEFNQILNDLRSADAEIRADAVLEIEPEGIGIRYLTDALRDPDPEVRMMAISQLEDGESPEALHGLVSALDDPDPAVVVEAIDALEYVGDSSVIRDLELLLQDANEEVRTAAQDAIEYLED